MFENSVTSAKKIREPYMFSRLMMFPRCLFLDASETHRCTRNAKFGKFETRGTCICQGALKCLEN
jgi:hypothetical protein